MMRKLATAAFILLLSLPAAFAQSGGQQAGGGGNLASYLPLGGGTMTGKLVTAPSATGGAGLNVPPGTAPSSPANGDLWTTTAGLYAQINGATVGPLAVTPSLATNAVKGIMEGDTTTISCTAGVCTAVGAAATSVAVGTTTITGGTTNGLLYDNVGVLGNIATGNNGVLVTSGAGVPSISTTLPAAVQNNITGIKFMQAMTATTGMNAFGGI